MEDQIHITVWRDEKAQKREVEQFTEDGTLESWFKVTVSVLVTSALDFPEVQEKEDLSEQDKSVTWREKSFCEENL